MSFKWQGEKCAAVSLVARFWVLGLSLPNIPLVGFHLSTRQTTTTKTPRKRRRFFFLFFRDTCCSPTVTVLMASADSSGKGMIFFFLFGNKKNCWLPRKMNAPECPQRHHHGTCCVQGLRKKSRGNKKCFRSYALPVVAGRGMLREIADVSFGTTPGAGGRSRTMGGISLLCGTGRTWWCTYL